MFDDHVAPLVAYARQWVDATAAEDVVQRVFVRLLTAGRLPVDAKTWLFRCVRNEAISAWRSGRRRKRRERETVQSSPVWFVSTPEDAIDAATAQAAVEALPLDQREVIMLRLWSGLTLKEIAAVTGAGVTTVHDRYHAALAILRQRLELRCETPSHPTPRP